MKTKRPLLAVGLLSFGLLPSLAHALSLTTSSSPAAGGTTTGAGTYTEGQIFTVTAEPNDCYNFADWTQKSVVVSTNPTYTSTIGGGEALVAHFTLKEDAIMTASNPAKGGTTTGKGTYGCDKNVTVTAMARAGYKFIGWTVDGTTVSTANPYTFRAADAETLTANFSDVSVPTVTITSPTTKPVDTTLLEVSGTARNVLGVGSVVLTLNGDPVSVTTTNNWTNWSGSLILPPGTNRISATALSEVGRASRTDTVSVENTATGQAPVALAGLIGEIQAGTNAPFQVSFGTATLEQFNADTNQGSGVGSYTYTQTGPDTATLVINDFAPPDQAGGGSSPVYLTFTSPTNATFTSSGGQDTGTVTLAAGSGLDVSSQSGWTITFVDAATNTTVTTFGDGAFTSHGSGGTIPVGDYTSAQYGPMAAMVVETNHDSSTGVTYVLLMFASRSNGQYFLTSYAGPASGPSYDSRAFTGAYQPSGLDYVAPETLNGMSFGGGILTFGQATLGDTSFSTSTNDLSGVDNYTYTRTGPNTATLIVNPYLPRPTAGTSTSLLTFQSAQRVIIDNITASISYGGSLTPLRPADYFAPVTLPRVATVDFNAVVAGYSGSASLNYGAFTIDDGSGRPNGKSGTYTYSQFSPTVGMITFTYTDAADAGQVTYFQETFTSATGGDIPGDAYSTKSDGEITIGTFTIVK